MLDVVQIKDRTLKTNQVLLQVVKGKDQALKKTQVVTVIIQENIICLLCLLYSPFLL